MALSEMLGLGSAAILALCVALYVQARIEARLIRRARDDSPEPQARSLVLIPKTGLRTKPAQRAKREPRWQGGV